MIGNDRAMPLLRPIVVALVLAVSMPASATDATYEPRLMRLAEVLGALHYLRNLCGDPGTQWRDRMQEILAAENPDGERRARFIASFNRGYRAFATNYASCTDSALAAIQLYMKEGEDISAEIVARYAN